MRPILRVYVAAVVLAALLLIALPPGGWHVSWYTCHPLLIITLLVLCILGEHLTFQVQSGWSTHAGTPPHLATALLLPPGLATIVGAIGILVYVVNRRQPPLKATFNTASVTLSVGVASLVVSAFGGGHTLVEPGWLGPVVAIVASAVYYLVSAVTVAGVVALDQHRSFVRVLRGKIGLKTFVEIGLGLVGATFATLVLAAPGFAPALVLPAALVYFAKRAIDRGTAQARNLALTNTVGRAVAGTLSLTQAFEAITDRSVREALRLDGLAVLPLDAETRFEPRVAADRDQPRLRNELASRVAHGESQVHLHRPSDIPREWIDVTRANTYIVAAALPCSVGSDAPHGALVAWRSAGSAEPFAAAELLMLQTLADYAAVALETTRLFDEAILGRQEAEEREARIQAVMQNVADGLLTFNADGEVDSANPAAVRIFGASARTLVGQPITTLLPDLADGTQPVDAGRVLHREVDGVRANGKTVPLEVAITAILETDAPRYIAVVRDVSERRAFEHQLRHMAFHDPLTGLPNRALFMDRIEHALTVARNRGKSIGVLFLDLDNFKVVNDNLGHAMGDQLLIKIAERLRLCLGIGQTLARFGGDEFTVLLDEETAIENPELMAARLRATMEQPFILAGREVFATVSVGIAISTQDTDSAGDLLRNADVAMYRAKAGGRAQAVKFDRGVDSDAVARLEFESDLRSAVERGELELHYQPIVDLATGRIDDLEALIRWRHPRHGLIPPDRFISLAEDTGLIIPIGQWVLDTACRQLKAWQRSTGHDALSISVNLSVRQFQHPTLLDDIARALRNADLAPERLTIEVTESLAMRDATSAAALLGQLKNLGVRVAIDDFGTGYSSLSYLHRFPADLLKIDRSFVSRLGRERHDHAIVEAIVALSHGLEMEVTAEGIETSEQLSRLAALGVERGQGYYFSKPVPADIATSLLTAPADTDTRAA